MHRNGGDVSDTITEQVGVFEISLGVQSPRYFK